MSENKLVSRRSFFQFALTAFYATPLILSSLSFKAEGCPVAPPAGKAVAKVGEGMAKTLQYVEDAKVSKSPKYKAGSDCGNCKFYNAAKAADGFAPCTMMGMKFVSNCGWCVSYAAKS